MDRVKFALVVGLVKGRADVAIWQCGYSRFVLCVDRISIVNFDINDVLAGWIGHVSAGFGIDKADGSIASVAIGVALHGEGYVKAQTIA